MMPGIYYICNTGDQNFNMLTHCTNSSHIQTYHSNSHPLFQVNCYWLMRGRRGRDRMAVGFSTTYAISTYHHWCCEFESRSGRGVQHYV